MKLSVVVSTYNQAAYIEACLRSIVEAIRDIDAEIIVADDCSPDGTGDIASRYCLGLKVECRVLTGDVNLGANRNYVRGHSAAKGKFVAHVDGDDLVDPAKFVRQLAIMDKSPGVSLCVHGAEYFNDSGATTAVTGLLGVDAFTEFTRDEFALWGPIAAHSSFMYRRSALDIGLIPIPFMEWYVGMLVLSTGRGVFINSRLLRYRSNLGGGSMTATSRGRRRSSDIHNTNVMDWCRREPLLGRVLYAQLVFNLSVNLSRRCLPIAAHFFFVVSKFLLFRPGLVLRVYRVRQALRPVALEKQCAKVESYS